LKDYAPEYDALGKTLGEKLLDGFKDKVGGIVDWFEGLNSAMIAYQEGISAQMNDAANNSAICQRVLILMPSNENSAPKSVDNCGHTNT